MVVERSGLEHGIRAQVARELGVNRSTVSRGIAASNLGSRGLDPKAQAQLGRVDRRSGPLGERLVTKDCQGVPQDLEEPGGTLKQVLKFVAELLFDAVENGKMTRPPEDIRLVGRPPGSAWSPCCADFQICFEFVESDWPKHWTSGARQGKAMEKSWTEEARRTPGFLRFSLH